MGFKEKYGQNVAVIGASVDRSRYSNKAVRAFRAAGYNVFPVNPNEAVIQGLVCYARLADIPSGIDFASLYLNPRISLTTDIAGQLKSKGIEMVIVNPGAESDELIEKLYAVGIEAQMICSLRALGVEPEEF